MSDPVAFSATLVDVKLIRTRKCVQFLFEEDVSQLPANIVEHLGGLAALANGKIHCAIARLINEGAEPKNPDTHNANSLKTDERQGRSPTQRAAISCNAPMFRVFLERQRGGTINDYHQAHGVVCEWLEIESLKELDSDNAVAARWEELWAKYITWKSAARYVEAT